MTFDEWWMLLSKVPYRGKEEIARLAWDVSENAMTKEVERLRADITAAKSVLDHAAKSLIEVARMPNIEHVADAHNETVRRIRALGLLP